MKKRILAMLIAGVMGASLLAGCGDSEPAAAEAPAATEEAADSTGSASGITFEDLQNNYALLVDCYNEVEKLYMDEAIAQDDTTESLLTEAKGIIEQMGEATEEDFQTPEDYKTMNDSMVTMLDALSGIVDGMNAADTSAEAGSADEGAADIKFVDGFYANDGSSDFMIAFYEGAAGDVAYVNDGSNEVLAEYVVEKAELDDGTEYYIVTVGNTQLGYYEEGSDVYLIDDEGNIYAAAHLTEAEADELAKVANS